MFRERRRFLYVAVLSAVLTTLVYQIPVQHHVDLGGYDSAYLRSFSDPVLSAAELEGSDGSARWLQSEAFLLFPQAGWPAQISMHVRAKTSSQVQLLVNGIEQRSLSIDQSWQEVAVPVPVSLFKPEDTLLTLRSSSEVLIDRASYTVGPAPILPAPSQLLYAVLLSMLIFLGVRGQGSGIRQQTQDTRHKTQDIGVDTVHSKLNCTDATSCVSTQNSINPSSFLIAAFPALLLLIFYRIQTPYPYPLRGLLQTLCLLLAAGLAVRHAPMLKYRAAWLPDALALLGMLGWAMALWNAAQAHVVRSVPGVENDFRVFATRTDLASIFKADGFYNLGYPFLLWLVGPLTAHNPWLAGRLVGLLAALVVLVATWWLGRVWLGRAAALLALAMVALSPLFVQHALYLGSDMPFAALCMLTLAFLVGPKPYLCRRLWSQNRPAIMLRPARVYQGAGEEGNRRTGEQEETQDIRHKTEGAGGRGQAADLTSCIPHPASLGQRAGEEGNRRRGEQEKRRTGEEGNRRRGERG